MIKETKKKLRNINLDCNKNNFPSLKNPFHDEKKMSEIPFLRKATYPTRY